MSKKGDRVNNIKKDRHKRTILLSHLKEIELDLLPPPSEREIPTNRYSGDLPKLLPADSLLSRSREGTCLDDTQYCVS